jgi:NAD-dependent deacetylase sirtuin 4
VTTEHAATRRTDGFAELVACLRGRSIAVLTGAGISTESGIPDYRGPGTRARAKDPMRFAEYTASGVGRARYWVRAMVGWPSFAAARPNAGHLALADLEARGLVRGVVTQNVDRLHHGAGSRRVVELHGALHEVRCLDCGTLEPRAQVQRRLGELNPHVQTAVAQLRPDGDADLPTSWTEGFRVPACPACGPRGSSSRPTRSSRSATRSSSSAARSRCSRGTDSCAARTSAGWRSRS